MFEIGITSQFEAAHQLVGDFGPATRFHGHTYRLEVQVRGPKLKDDGTLFDIARLQDAVASVVARMHYRDLAEVEGLAGINTTAENVANFIWEALAPTLRGQGLESLTVRLWENPNAYAAREDQL